MLYLICCYLIKKLTNREFDNKTPKKQHEKIKLNIKYMDIIVQKRTKINNVYKI